MMHAYYVLSAPITQSNHRPKTDVFAAVLQMQRMRPSLQGSVLLSVQGLLYIWPSANKVAPDAWLLPFRRI